MASRRDLMVKAMDALLQAGVDVGNVQQWCQEHGVNPRTFYRHRQRIRADGTWIERSRRPHTSPAVDPDLEAWVLKLRKDLVENGADFILDELKRIRATSHVRWEVPSRSTVNRILSRHDLLDRNPAKRPRSSYRRFSYARPRDCYQIDATEVVLAGGDKAVVFDVLDDCTRKLVACHAALAETSDAAIAAITKAKKLWGAPGIVLSDNGAAFTQRFIHPNAGPSRFATTVHRWGTRLIHSSPYHPQTCGKVERHHQTLKKWLRNQPPPATLTELQHLLDRYRAYYNNDRAHSAIGRATPATAWANAPSYGGPTDLPVQTDATIHTLTVSDTGTIRVGRNRIGVGRAYRGQILTAIRDHHRITIYTPDGRPLGHATTPEAKSYTAITRTQDPL